MVMVGALCERARGGQDQERGNRAHGGAGEGDIFRHSDRQTSVACKVLLKSSAIRDEPLFGDVRMKILVERPGNLTAFSG
ncbi:hypothetical protein OVY29_08015 [Sphingopyxis sp. SE2]|uniref:hypothetical protein n=1 Tax=Sphingopyxis sp. SE2 TaxID=1586240 RepID=UPI0028C010FC|nr:hypothetical protein [Sphingopyxis sp. SE2]MDT7528598.1 hypothetical protein [Sphingopyxis sp. SE2]